MNLDAISVPMIPVLIVGMIATGNAHAGGPLTLVLAVATIIKYPDLWLDLSSSGHFQETENCGDRRLICLGERLF
jgi:hypothetical protein